MKKVLETELLSMAHRILRMKDKEVDSLLNDAKSLYEKLLILKFYQDNFELGLIKDITLEDLEGKLELHSTGAVAEKLNMEFEQRHQMPEDLLEQDYPLVVDADKEELVHLQNVAKVTPELPQIDSYTKDVEYTFLENVPVAKEQESSEEVEVKEFLEALEDSNDGDSDLKNDDLVKDSTDMSLEEQILVQEIISQANAALENIDTLEGQKEFKDQITEETDKILAQEAERLLKQQKDLEEERILELEIALEEQALEEQRLEQERLEQERLEQERLEQERLEQERLEQERLEQERLEQERLEQERLEQERLEQERLEQERLEQERLEQERLEQERLEQERLEQEEKDLEELIALEEQNKLKTEFLQDKREDNPFDGFNFMDLDFERVTGSSEHVIVNENLSELAKDKEEQDTLFNLESTAVTQPQAPKIKSINDIYNTVITVGLNDRIAFEKNLFGGSGEDFNRVLSQLNTVSSFEEAQSLIDHLVKPEYGNWEGKQEYEERFMQIIEKRFN